jgi:hypothetical protein
LGVVDLLGIISFFCFSRHSSRGLPTGSAIRCHSSTSCAGAYDSGLVRPRLHDVATGGVGDSFVLLPRIL